MRIFLILITISLSALGLGGCSVYKIDVQQGNTLDAEQVSQLKIGLTRKQVTFILGSPMIRDPFHPDRWDYAYAFKPGGEEMFKQHLSLFFEDDKLVRIENKLVKTGEDLPSKSQSKLKSRK